MLQIVKIQQTALFLRGDVERIIGLDQLCQAIQRRGGHLDIRCRVIRIERKRRLHIADCLFECVAPRLYAVGKRLIEDVRLFLSSQRGKGNIMRRNMQRDIAFFRLLRQIFRQTHVRFACRRVMRRAVFAKAYVQRSAGGFCEIEQPLSGALRQQLCRRAVFKRLPVDADTLLRTLQKRPRVGARHHEAMQRKRQLAKLILRIAPVRGKERVAAHFVTAVNRVLHRLTAQHAALLLVADAEARVDAQCLKIFAQKIAAEAVQRRDACPRKRHQLFAERRLLSRGFAQCFADAQAHFARRRVGKRHHEHPVNRAALPHKPNDALDQHGGLARACRRTDDQAVSPVLDGSLLLLCPLWHKDLLYSLRRAG